MFRISLHPCVLTLLVAIPCLHFNMACADQELTKGTFDAKGVTIAYFTQGQGEPVVLIHGLHSDTALNWQLPGIIDEIARKYRVIALDLPGHGASDKPADESAYGEQMAEDVALLMDHLKIEKAHILGYSLGGMVALKFTSLHQDRVNSLILGGMGWLKEGGLLQRFWSNVSGRENSKTPDACIKGIARLAVSEPDLKAIRVPVTVIIGSQDPVKRMYVRPLTSARSDWPVVEIQDTGHLTCIIKPQFRREIMNWLDKQSRP